MSEPTIHPDTAYLNALLEAEQHLKQAIEHARAVVRLGRSPNLQTAQQQARNAAEGALDKAHSAIAIYDDAITYFDFEPQRPGWLRLSETVKLPPTDGKALSGWLPPNDSFFGVSREPQGEQS